MHFSIKAQAHAVYALGHMTSVRFITKYVIFKKKSALHLLVLVWEKYYFLKSYWNSPYSDFQRFPSSSKHL